MRSKTEKNIKEMEFVPEEEEDQEKMFDEAIEELGLDD
jgi:hypothetical protein